MQQQVLPRVTLAEHQLNRVEDFSPNIVRGKDGWNSTNYKTEANTTRCYWGKCILWKENPQGCSPVVVVVSSLYDTHKQTDRHTHTPGLEVSSFSDTYTHTHTRPGGKLSPCGVHLCTYAHPISCHQVYSVPLWALFFFFLRDDLTWASSTNTPGASFQPELTACPI